MKLKDFERKYKSENVIRYINNEYKSHGKGKNDIYFKFVNKNYGVEYTEWKNKRNFISKVFKNVKGLDNFSALTYLMISGNAESLSGLQNLYEDYKNFKGKRYNYSEARFIFSSKRTETFRRMYGDFKVSEKYSKTLNDYYNDFKEGKINHKEFSIIMNEFKDYNKKIIDSRQQYDTSMFFNDI